MQLQECPGAAALRPIRWALDVQRIILVGGCLLGAVKADIGHEMSSTRSSPSAVDMKTIIGAYGHMHLGRGSSDRHPKTCEGQGAERAIPVKRGVQYGKVS